MINQTEIKCVQNIDYYDYQQSISYRNWIKSYWYHFVVQNKHKYVTNGTEYRPKTILHIFCVWQQQTKLRLRGRSTRTAQMPKCNGYVHLLKSNISPSLGKIHNHYMTDARKYCKMLDLVIMLRKVEKWSWIHI